MAFIFNKSVEPEVIYFSTVHDFSRAGVQTQGCRWQLAQLARGAGLLVAVLAMLASLALSMLIFLVADSVVLPVEHDRYVTSLEIAFAIWLLLTGLAMVLLLRLAPALRLPPALCTLEKWPFRVERIPWAALS